MAATITKTDLGNFEVRLDKRFDAIDEQFKKNDKHYSKINKRFSNIDNLLDKITKTVVKGFNRIEIALNN